MNTDGESPSSGVASRVSSIGGAIFVSAALGYILLAILSRVLGPDEYSRFLSIWGVIFGIGSTLAVMEQEVARRAAHDVLVGRKTGRDIARMCVVSFVIVLSAHTVIVASPLAVRLYGSHGTWATAAMVFASSLGFIVQFAIKGLLIGHGRTHSYALLFSVEAVIRITALGAFFLLVGHLDTQGSVFAVVIGSFAWLVVMPGAARLIDMRQQANESWFLVTRSIVTLGTGMASTAALLTGFPSVATMVLGSSAGLGTVFTVITATRVPLLLVTPIQAMVIPAVVHRVERQGRKALVPVMIKGGSGILGLVALSLVVGWLWGPFVVRLMFGKQYNAPAWSVSIMAATSVLIGAAQLLAAALVALDRHRMVAISWGMAVAVCIVVLAVGTGSGTAIVTNALAAASIVAVAATMTGMWITVRQSS